MSSPTVVPITPASLLRFDVVRARWWRRRRGRAVMRIALDGVPVLYHGGPVTFTFDHGGHLFVEVGE